MPSHPRTPNLALRSVRQAMRLSQTEFAEAIRTAGNAMEVRTACTKRLVQKWETGEHASCRPDYLKVLQVLTGLSARDLGFHLPPDTADVTAGLNEHPTAHMIGPAIDRLRHALEHPSTVDSQAAELVRSSTERLFVLHRHSPSRLLAPTVYRHLTTVTALLNAARHERVRQSLMRDSGRSALLGGWLAFDRGNMAFAHRDWDTATSAAESTADAPLLAAILICQSYSAARRHDPDAAWELAHSASLHCATDPRTAAWATSRAALHAAELGARADSLAAMDRAMKLGADLPRPCPGDGNQPWSRTFDYARLLSATARTAAILCDDRAATYAEGAIRVLGPAPIKSRAIVLAECAFVAATHADLDHCYRYGEAAAALTRELDVSVAADILHSIVPLVMPHSTTLPIRRLLPYLAELPRTADMEDEAGARSGRAPNATREDDGWGDDVAE